MREDDVVVGGEVGELGELGVEVGAPHDEPGDLGEVAQHARQQGRPDRGEGEQRDLAAGVVAELVPQRRGAFEGDRDVGRAACEGVPRAREHEAATAALGQRHAGLALEHLELLRHGRRRSPGGLGHGRDAAAFGEFPEQVEAADFHVASLHRH